MSAEKRFEVPAGVGIRVVVDGEFYTVDELIEGDPVLRPQGEHGGVRGDSEASTVELHFVPPDDDIAELYTTDNGESEAPDP